MIRVMYRYDNDDTANHLIYVAPNPKNENVSSFILQLSFPDPLKPSATSRMNVNAY